MILEETSPPLSTEEADYAVAWMSLPNTLAEFASGIEAEGEPKS
jgi:hypothetical protein